MIKLVNMICNNDVRRKFEKELGDRFSIEQVSPRSWEVMYHPYTSYLAEKPMLALFNKMFTWIIVYDNSPFSNKFLCMERGDIWFPAKNSLFVVYAQKNYLDYNKDVIQQLANERLCKFYKPEEIHDHVFLINADNNDGFERLLDAMIRRKRETGLFEG